MEQNISQKLEVLQFSYNDDIWNLLKQIKGSSNIENSSAMKFSFSLAPPQLHFQNFNILEDLYITQLNICDRTFIANVAVTYIHKKASS